MIFLGFNLLPEYIVTSRFETLIAYLFKCAHHKQPTSYKRCIVIKTLQSNTESERHNLSTIILL